MFESEYALDYYYAYRIEMTPVKDIKEMINNISNNFDKYKSTLGDKFPKLLLRILRYCKNHNQEDIEIIDKLLDRLGIDNREVGHINISSENEIMINLIHSLKGKLMKTLDINEDIINTVYDLENGVPID